MADINWLMDDWRVPQHSEKAIIIVCGDNDVKKCSQKREEEHCQRIVNDIIAVAEEMKERFGDSCKIIVCQLMPRSCDQRCPHFFDERYNIKAQLVNKSFGRKAFSKTGDDVLEPQYR